MMRPLAVTILFMLFVFDPTVCFAQPAKSTIPVYQAISTPDFGYLPTYVARAKGFFTDERLDLKVIVANSRVSVPALIANEVHFGVAGPSITASLRGAPLKAVYFIYNTSTFQFTVRPEIRTAEDLKGKTIAISSPGATNDMATRLILAKLAANNPDVAAELVRKGFRILMHSGEVFPVPFSGSAVNEKLIRENPDVIMRWLRAHLKAMLLIRQRPDEAAQIAAKDLKLNLDIAREATTQVLQFMYPNDPGGFTEKGMRIFLQQTAPRLGIDPDKVAISQIADLSFLREAQRALGIKCRDGYGC
jgi:ABC-type nitrate/sulfonate/bicarbonate transport system substrate-binding protein